MNVRYGELPPNFASILAALPAAGGKGVIFAYSPDVYTSSREPLPPQLEAHEAVHLGQQAAYEGGVERWWEAYLAYPAFRLGQEVPAHRAEYRAYCALTRDRERRSNMAAVIARKLCSQLYGALVTYTEALSIVTSL